MPQTGHDELENLAPASSERELGFPVPGGMCGRAHMHARRHGAGDMRARGGRQMRRIMRTGRFPDGIIDTLRSQLSGL